MTANEDQTKTALRLSSLRIVDENIRLSDHRFQTRLAAYLTVTLVVFYS